MRHNNAGRKFDRNTSHRRAMFRNLTANLILHERIETTDAKAKELVYIPLPKSLKDKVKAYWKANGLY